MCDGSGLAPPCGAGGPLVDRPHQGQPDPEQGKQGTYLKIRFSLIADEMNRQVWHNLSLATGAQWKVNKTLTDLGLAKGENTFKSRAEYELAVQAMLTGAECSITVENEDYEGSVQDRVVKIEARS